MFQKKTPIDGMLPCAHCNLQWETCNSDAPDVSWFVSTGTFDFKVLIRDRPFTSRGILSMVNSVHDLLGMAAPFILPGMLFHQDLDPKGLEWDDEILENRLIP